MWRKWILCVSKLLLSKRINMEPVLVILGATGTGKSKLALEIAKEVNGEIISADSMQIYKGLDIVTNKVTPGEKAIVKHHMLDFLSPLQSYTVVEFRDATLPIIKKLHAEGKLPVIVGGTHYYVESILWNVLVSSEETFEKHSRDFTNTQDIKTNFKRCNRIGIENNFEREGIDYQPFTPPFENSTVKSSNVICDSDIKEKCVLYSDGSESKAELSDSHSELGKYNNLSNTELLNKLEEIDPEIASRYHPNERRKILRSLEVWHQTGVRHSDHLRKQVQEVGAADLGGSLRFANAFVIWITCNKEILVSRLDQRVDAMLTKGLLEELLHFHATCNAPVIAGEGSSTCDVSEHYTKGIFQSIGLKEFHEYLLLNEEDRESQEGKALLEKGIEAMKLRTRQYAKRQDKWMRNRFLIRNRQRVPVYALDGSDLDRWDENVRLPALEIVNSIVEGKNPAYEPVKLDPLSGKANGDKTRHYCEVCKRIFIGNHQWEEHLKSKRHGAVLKKLENEIAVAETVKNSLSESSNVL